MEVPVWTSPLGPEVGSPPITPRTVSGLFKVATLGMTNIAPVSSSIRIGPLLVIPRRRALTPFDQLPLLGSPLERWAGPPLKRITAGDAPAVLDVVIVMLLLLTPTWPS